MQERKQITLDELDQRIQQNGPAVGMSDVQVNGIVTIKDKDGNVKSEMEITTLEINEEI